MLYREIFAVCSHFYTKHINTLCGAECKFRLLLLTVQKVTTGLQRSKYVKLLAD